MLQDLIVILPILLVSVAVHEYAHARVALSQGDRTALALGRVTLNPLRHIDPMGSIVVPLVMWFMSNGTAVFGWAKPVPVNPLNYRNYKRGDILVSAAGVVSNFILAAGFVVAFILLVYVRRAFPGMAGLLEIGLRMAQFGILINLVLAVFNLIPVPPLDGSHIFYHLLPRDLGARYRALSRFGFIPLLLLFFVPGLLQLFLWPVRVLNDLAFWFIGLWV
ncbi:MAG: site-2 protease family protein [Gemmatimonadota bacterium]